jgi:CHAP domain
VSWPLEPPLRFAFRYLGQRVGDGQCVALADEWLREGYAVGPVYANAVDWAGPKLAALPGWLWVENGPTNYPAAGNVVVWKAYAGHGIGPYGHVAVCQAACAMVLLSVDQNWPTDAPVSLTLHDFAGVAGWWAAP